MEITCVVMEITCTQYNIIKKRIVFRWAMCCALQVMKKFSELSEVMHKRHQQEADSQYAAQRFTWVNNIHQNGLYDMPILGSCSAPHWFSNRYACLHSTDSLLSRDYYVTCPLKIYS